jgi:hypothetical protein
MRYQIRLNPKAFNPLTLQVIAKRLWEVEQVGNRDSEPVIWHCADVRIDDQHVRELFQMPKPGEPPWQIERYGTCARGQDDAIVIVTGPADASGN